MSCKRKAARGEKVLPLLVRTENLKRYYQQRNDNYWFRQDTVKAVNGVDISIYEGETLGLVGESGCGKSTLGRLIIGLEAPTAGEVIYRMQPLHELGGIAKDKARLDMQMIFQDPYAALNPRKRIYDILSTPLLYHNLVDKRQVGPEVTKLLELVGLPAHSARRYPHEFSGGQLQRVGIAAALSLKPRLIVCDEPVSALDVSIQAQILNLLCALQEERGFAYLFIAHGLAAVKYISDRIAVMYLGKIVELAPAEDLFNRPLHPYTQALISAAPIPHPDLPADDASLLRGEVPSNVDPPTGCPFHPRCPLVEPACRELCPELETDGSVFQDGGCRAFRKAHCVACPPMLRELHASQQAGREPRLAFPGAKRTANFSVRGAAHEV